MKPSGLCHAVGDGAILGFCTGVRDDGLPLGQLGHLVIPQEHCIAGHRAARV
jgi:hypothetical protein